MLPSYGISSGVHMDQNSSLCLTASGMEGSLYSQAQVGFPSKAQWQGGAGYDVSSYSAQPQVGSSGNILNILLRLIVLHMKVLWYHKHIIL